MSSELPVGKIVYRPGSTMDEVADLKITVNGKPSHCSQPWLSVDPILVSAQMINNLQTIVSRNMRLTDNAAVVTIGAINGGNRFHIISEQVEMQGTVRTFTDEDETYVFDRIRQVAEKTFSFFAHKVPGLLFFLGGLPAGKDPETVGPHHTLEFLIDDSSFKTGITAFCHLVFDYMELNKN